ncbi:MAG: nucleotidyltransferase domain-containing protein [Candidatus Undinarchaeales archaeon]|jgi:predicted nucleotidyltransferase|nr:nucleotidyltransferase domain-containing protein [Candidatus Undinarchaeales archaeon]MDP7492397.1 nucleotidyltransferase domain-containing protein [Candidatus Undinarchaeales archaeon]
MIITASKVRLLDIILSEPGTPISSAIQNARMNPRYATDFINEAVREGIIIEERIGGDEKAHVRRLYPSLTHGLPTFHLVEMEKRIAFLMDHPRLKGPFSQISRLIEKNGGFALVFGSYARSTENEESDLDLLVVCGDRPDESSISEPFVLVDERPSMMWETHEEFSERRGDPLHVNVRRDHVIICGTDRYLNAIT